MLLNTKLEAKIGDFGLARNEEYKAAAVSDSFEINIIKLRSGNSFPYKMVTARSFRRKNVLVSSGCLVLWNNGIRGSKQRIATVQRYKDKFTSCRGKSQHFI